RRISRGFERLDIVGMDAAAKIRITRHTSRLESKDGLLLRRAGHLACARVPIPDTNARSQLRQPKPLLALAQSIVGLVALNDIPGLSHIEIKQTQILLSRPVRGAEMGRQDTQRHAPAAYDRRRLNRAEVCGTGHSPERDEKRIGLDVLDHYAL